MNHSRDPSAQLEHPTLGQLARLEPACVTESTSLREVLEMMAEQRLSSVVVVRDRLPVGIFTERDALEVVLSGKDAAHESVTKRMTPNPLTCSADQPYIEGYRLMEQQGIRHLVLVDGKGDLAGMVTETDFVAAMDEVDFLRPRRVDEVMVRTPVTVAPDEPIASALAQMLERGISSVVVVSDGKPLGLLTERDACALYDRYPDLGQVAVETVMSAPAVGIQPDALLHDASTKMRAATVRRLVVVDAEGRLVGFLSRRDLVKDLRSLYEDLLRDLVHHQARELSRLRRELHRDFVLDNLLQQENLLGVVAADAKAQIRFINRAARRFAGLAEQAPIAAPIDTLAGILRMLGGDGTALARRVAALVPGETWRCEHLRNREGHLALQCEIFAVATATNRIAGYLLIIHDITERDESERRFAKIFVSTPSAVVITRLSDGVILEANTSFFRLSGYPVEEVLGRSSATLNAWVSREDRGRYLGDIQAGRTVQGLRTRFRCKDGTILNAVVNGEPIELHGESCALSVMTDVTAEFRYLRQIERQYELFEHVFESVPDAFVISNPEGRVLMANRAVERVFGIAPADLIGRGDAVLYAAQEDCERLARERLDPDTRVFRAPYRLRYRRADGETFEGETVGTVMRDPRGQSIGSLAIVRDVSEREAERQALARSEQRLQDLVDLLADWFWEIDCEANFTEVSNRVLNVLGYDPGWLIGKTPFDIMPVEEARRARTIFETTAAQGQDVQCLELVHLNRSGQPRIMQTSATPVRDDDGRLLGYRGTSRDVTEARRATEALAASQAQLQAIFDNANVGIMLLTGYRILSRCNQRLADILGYPDPAAMAWLSMRTLHLSEECFINFGREHYARLRDNEQLHIEVQLRRQDGSPVWCLLSGKALDTAHPADLNQGVIWTVDDISDLKRKEHELERLNAHLEQDQALFTQGPALVFRWRAEPGWPVEYCSPTVESVLGIPAQALLAGDPPFAELIHPDDRVRVAAEIEAHVQAGRDGYEQTYRLQTSDGQQRHFYDYTRVLRNAEGTLIGYHGYLVDITEQRRQELELRALLDALPDPIFFKDPDGCYLECNEATVRIIGRPRERILGATDKQLFADPLAERLRRCDQLVLEQGECRREEWLSLPDGTRRLLDIRKQPFTRAGDQAAGVLAISHDITTQHLQARMLERAQRLARIGSSRLDLQTGTSVWSAELYAILGLDPHHCVPGMETLLAHVEPRDRERVARVLVDLESVRSGQAELEFCIRRADDGSRRWLHSRRELVHDDQGAAVFVESVVQDITEQQQARLALNASEARYRDLFESAGQPMLLIGTDGAILQVNRSAAELLGYADPQALVGALIQSLSPIRQLDGQLSTAKAGPLLRDALEQGLVRFEWDYSDVHGQTIAVEVSIARVSIQDQTCLLASWYDLRDRRRAAELEQRATMVFANTVEGIMITDADNRIVTVNPAFSAITGYAEEEVIGRLPSLLQSGRHDAAFYRDMWKRLSETGHWQGEIWNRHKNGDVYPEWLALSLIRDETGKVQKHFAVFSEISEQYRNQERIEALTYYDQLTGLPNQKMLRLRLEQALLSAMAAGESLMVLSLKLHEFKHVIASFGHTAADAALVACAERLRKVLPTDAILALPGGDNFIVAQQCGGDMDAASKQATALQTALREEARVAGIGAFGMSSCVGISLAPTDAEDADILVRYAGVAMEMARQTGPGSVTFYQPEMAAAAKRRIELEHALRKALAEDAFELYYQPKLDLRSGQMCGAEALIRWRQADGTVVSPAEFMPVVETTDLVHQVGRWVIESAAKAIADWRAQGLSPGSVSVNISSATLSAGLLASTLEDAIDANGLDPTLLEVEVLENIMLQDPTQAKAELLRARQLGVRIALDDFGTGYSSLSYLKQFPFDTIKIDRCFIMDLKPSSDDTAIVRSTLSMAQQLGLEVVAEGVSSDDQLRLLQSLGCEKAQGYLIARPMPATAFTDLLRDPQSLLDPNLATLIGRAVLLVGADTAPSRRLASDLASGPYRVLRAPDADEASRLLAGNAVAMIVVDGVGLGDVALDLLERLRQTTPQIPRVLLYERAKSEMLLAAINRGQVAYCLDSAYQQDDLRALLRLDGASIQSAISTNELH